MRTVTTYSRWLGVVLLMACLAGNAYAQRNVTLRLNTATLPDTLDAMDVIQIRGAVEGTGNVALPDGNIIDWNDNTTLTMTNVGGDYWETTFQVWNDSTMAFKFYSQLAEDDMVGGWEDNPAEADNHMIGPGTNDSTLALHFFNKGASNPYDWTPFEDKQDSVGVHLRVFMNTEAAVTAGYDPDASAIGVRGDPLGGDSQLDWGASLLLSREDDDQTHPGYHLFSGMVYYPVTAAGTEQPFKFIVDPDGWEGDPNRTFNVPQNDTTLQWVYFDRSKPLSTQPVESNVIFAVDLAAFETIGVFRRARGDSLYVFGDFNGWNGCRDDRRFDECLMEREPGADLFAAAVPLTLVPEASLGFKYFLDFNNEEFMTEFGEEPPSGWEEGHRTGNNRRFVFAGTPEQDLGTQFFNDVTSDNVIPEGTSIDVTFSVDLAAGLTNDAQPFDPAGGDSVSVRLGDPVWAFTQGFNVATDRGTGDFPNIIDDFILEDGDGDGIYEGTLTVSGPSYNILTFRYLYGQENTFFEDQGTDTNTPGRNRVHFITKNADGTYPATYAVPAGTFQVEIGPLPFEVNPVFTGVEAIDSEVPEAIWLGANYPNPFNPTTTFEYALDRTQNVKIRVYDMLGRMVATLVDGVQPAATYQVTFDADQLASGVYLYQLETPTRVLTQRMLLVK